MKFLPFVLCLLVSISATSQSSFLKDATKPIIDTTAINNWIVFDYYNNPVISSDGQYIAYGTKTNNYDRSKRLNKLIVKATSGTWKKEFPVSSPVNAIFVANNQLLFLHKDSLYFVGLSKEHLTTIPNIKSFKSNEGGKRDWVVWLTKSDELTLQHLITGKHNYYREVTSYSFSDQGNTLILNQKGKDGAFSLLTWIDLNIGTALNVWGDSSASVISWAFDSRGEQLVFITTQNIRDYPFQVNKIWYYKRGLGKAVLKADDTTVGINSGLVIASFPAPLFTKDGKLILFSLMYEPERLKPLPGAASVDIWSYKDNVLQSAQTFLPQEKFLASASAEGDSVVRLQQNNEKVIVSGAQGKYIIVCQSITGDKYWLRRIDKNYNNYLVSLKNGARTVLPQGDESSIKFWLSPQENYVVYYKPNEQLYYSYNLRTEKEQPISVPIPKGSLAVVDEFMRPIMEKGIPVGIAGWTENEGSVLVYDNYDIWKLDLAGKKNPINITNGYGKSHKTKFRLMYDGEIIKENEKIFLVAFDVISKYNGFFQIQMNKEGDPILCSMGPYTYDLDIRNKYMLPMANGLFDEGMRPIKAKRADCWLIKRQSSTEAPNYFLTTDFKTFKSQTDIQPQKKCNWLTTELISFQQLDGTTSQGVLYKPENFDSTKKYPVLITYYRQYSHRLYNFPYADYAHSVINIPWFVSRGYLVFTPDIYFNDSVVLGLSATNSIVGAANDLSMMLFVDSAKMGIMGHSVAGAFTNHIITRSNKFAAAIVGAGVSNSIGSSFQLGDIGQSRISASENYGRSYDLTMWDNPGYYLDNMSVLKAHMVTTPVLIFHCKNDAAVPWQQALDMFTALWRLEKPVWMLQYDKGTHLVDGIDGLDYTIRITQFFDHYLKGQPAPRWMTEGIPAKKKQIDRGFELDIVTGNK